MEVASLPEGTYTREAAERKFPDAEHVSLALVGQVILAVENGEVDRGVVPLENVYEGHVIPTLDGLIDCKNTKIVGETFSEIRHYLGALRGHDEIKQIISHMQAIRQCDRYLHKNYRDVKLVAVGSTSEAVERVKKEGLLNAAAIASREAVGDLEILAEYEELCPNNKTRFVVLSREKVCIVDQEKTLLSIHPFRDEPGVLVDCLTPFKKKGINIVSAWSRPDAKWVGPDAKKGFYFFIELESCKPNKDRIAKAAALNDMGKDFEIRILGSYTDSKWKE